MAVPYTFASSTSAIPLSQLDSNFSTPITLGNTSVQLGNTVTTLNNMTLANVAISSYTSSSFTANGVVYASSTSALTTGSGLVFDGNSIGLGSTPSAWFGYKALQSGQSSLYESVTTVGLSSNSYLQTAGTSWTRINAVATARYDITSGVHKWFADASGAAGGSFTPTERMQLDNSGNLLVGTTTVSGAGGLTYLNQGSTGFASINNNNAGATGYVFSSYRRSSVEIGSVTQSGTTAVLFNTTSDRRLKTNITPAPSASDVIDAIEIVSHDWKAAPDEHVTYGVIAQDLALVAPQAVLQGDDGDEIEKTWGVDYSKLVPMLIKEIQSLRARVAALEAA